MNIRLIKKYLVKIDRIAAWALLPLITLFFIAGWSMTGKLVLIQPQKAQYLHTTFCIFVLIFFLIHSGIQIYFAIRKWKLRK